MRKLIDGTNVEGATSDYPKGRIKDETNPNVSGDGTVINEIIFGDVFQFFQKLIAEGAVTENNLPDNETNGYQLFQALTQAVYRKGVAGDKATINQSGTAYSIPDDIGVIQINYTSDSQQVINTPAPRQGRMIMIYANAARTQNRTFNFNSAGTWYDDQSIFNPVSLNGYNQAAMVSDGNKWTVLNWTDVLLACPFVYVNGMYFDEILKNHLGENNDKVEVLDISAAVTEGNNQIKITEEKDEITFIHYILLRIDDEIVFEMNYDTPLILEKGDVVQLPDFTIEPWNNKVELEAKGYYINV
jgi:hypothetical protein